MSALAFAFASLAGAGAASAQCTVPFGDVNGDGITNVVDAQCDIITVLWSIAGQVGPPPACTGGNLLPADTNCDAAITVADAQQVISASLGQPLATALDADGNGCPDTCDALACGDGSCDAVYETAASCPADCDTGSCCIANGSPGCNDPAVEAAVCAIDSFCCDTEWDSACADGASAVGGSCDGDCCAQNPTPGCDSTGDTACEECVCGLDPFCCGTSWDDLCAGAASATCATECGCGIDACGDGICDDVGGETVGTCPADCAGEGSCCTPNGDAGCADLAVQAAVCAADPFCCADEWDATCAIEAESIGGACMGDCCASNGDAGCDSTGALDCEICVCALDDFCCSTTWDAGCADCAAGGPGFADACLGGDCTTECGCDAISCGDGICDPAIGENELTCAADCAAAGCGDGICDPLSESTSNCPADCAGEGSCCLANGTPGCADTATQSAVCAADPFCCTGSFDTLCAALAESEAGACTGDCCAANPTAGCDSTADLACETCICAADPFCCSVQWDANCASDATTGSCAADCGCGTTCGDGVCDPASENLANCPVDCAGEGSCCISNGTPGCNNTVTQAAVCAADDFCCLSTWDGVCANLAETEAGDCTGDCCASNGTAGCDSTGDLGCEDCVCALDSFCCDTTWDSSCSECAAGGPGFLDVCLAGDCSTACNCVLDLCGDGTCDPGIGEDATTCPADCLAPCGDGICDEFAGETVFNCPADCAAAGCGDGTCDAGAGEDVTTCPLDCFGSNSCCIASSDGTAGCNSSEIQSAVCAVDPFCCNTEWDGLCAGETEDFGFCTGNCCEANGSEGCDSTGDLDCETAVCGADPFCCDSSWDANCAAAASTVFTTECGGCGPCGDGLCDDTIGEDILTCPADCAAPGCGDGTCDDGGGETVANCPADCVGTNDCCTPTDDGSPGCNDAAVQGQVCAIDAFCCTNNWDGVCAGESEAFGACIGDCCDGNGSTGCDSTGDLACETAVCAVDSFCCLTLWDQVCADEAISTFAVECGCVVDACGDGICDDTMGEDELTCPADCLDPCGDGTCDAFIGEDVFTCPLDCAVAGCGDGTCDDLGGETVGTCPLDCAGTNGCCVPSTDSSAGCADIALQNQVCAADAFCCNTEWDALCAQETENFGLCDGDCCAANPTNGCSSTGTTECEEAVCAADPFCCDTSWDTACADAANNIFATECECGATPSECCDPAGLGGTGIFCGDTACTDCVCAGDPFCCDTGWDGACANTTTGSNSAGCIVACGCGVVDPCGDGLCDAAIGEDNATCPADCPPTGVGCCNPVGLGGSGNFCDDTACSDCVCAADPFCCDTGWDAVCANNITGSNSAACAAACGCGAVGPCGDGICDPAIGEDNATCPADCPPAGGDCCDPLGLGGSGNFCNDTACSDCVCAADPFCCDTGWDGVCAGTTTGSNGAACAAACGCGAVDPCGDGICDPAIGEDSATCPADCPPAGGDCCDPLGLGGSGNFCDDTACSDCVCAADPFCCDTGWDAVCANNITGSNSAACAAACGCGAVDACGDGICDPAIGEDNATCPADCPPAGVGCCDPVGLGGAGIFCDDTACTDCVCVGDPFCCDTGWDGLCAGTSTGSNSATCSAACGCGIVPL